MRREQLNERIGLKDQLVQQDEKASRHSLQGNIKRSINDTDLELKIRWFCSYHEQDDESARVWGLVVKLVEIKFHRKCTAGSPRWLRGEVLQLGRSSTNYMFR